eukprot:evm.model.scf_664.2 EVM.evm.TU.scf_664.2   scf_664:9156-11420(+)
MVVLHPCTYAHNTNTQGSSFYAEQKNAALHLSDNGEGKLSCSVFASGAMSLNLRPPGTSGWRRRTLWSSVSLLFVNMMAVMQYADSLIRVGALPAIVKKRDSVWTEGVETERVWTSTPAHFFLISMATCCTLAADVLFIRLFGCCVFVKRVVPQRPGFNPGSPRLHKWQQSMSLDNEGGPPPTASADKSGAGNRLSWTDPHSEEFLRMSSTKEADMTSGVAPIDGAIAGPTTRPTVASVPTRGFFKLAQPAEGSSEKSLGNECAKEGNLASTAGGSSLNRAPKLQRWNTGLLLSNYKERSAPVESVTNAPQDLPHKDCPCDTAGPHFCTDPVASAHRTIKVLWDSVKEEDGKFRFSVWMKTSAFACIIVILYTTIRFINSVYRVSVDWESNHSEIRANIDELEAFLKGAEWIDDSIQDFFIGGIEYMDTLMPYLRHTVWVGYPIGALKGLHTLYIVMAKHKALSLAVESELLAWDGEGLQGQVGLVSAWPELEKKYPLGEAAYFLGILVSTAVVELNLFGMFITLVLGVIINVDELDTVMRYFGYIVVVYLMIAVVDWMVLHILPDKLLSQGYKIKWPRIFFLYMFVFSIVHLVLGALYALWRVFMVLLMSFAELNRLDTPMFRKWKSLDFGHRSFMSMLVLTHLIGKDSIKLEGRKALKSVVTLNRLRSFAPRGRDCLVSPSGLRRIGRTMGTPSVVSEEQGEVTKVADVAVGVDAGRVTASVEFAEMESSHEGGCEADQEHENGAAIKHSGE